MNEWNPDAGDELGNGRDEALAESFPASDPPAEDHDGAGGKPRTYVDRGDVAIAIKTSDAVAVRLESGETVELDHGHVVIAAITSCTNTSNPSVMLGAGLIAKKAVERGLRRQPWVKTSLAPGSTVVTDYLEKSGLDRYLNELQFNLVGYGCTTCIGNSGPLPEAISKAVNDNDLVVCSVLSGNRNFEGRINPDTRAKLPCLAAAGRRLRARRAHGRRSHLRAAGHGLRRRAGVSTTRSPIHDSSLTEFDLARAVFGIGYRFDDRTVFNSEFEIEHAVASADDAGEFEVEQFYVDHQLADWASVKAGLFLMPFGLLNEHHEPTNFYGVQRNFVETLIIPSTWREGGVGFHGTTAGGLTWDVGVTSGVNMNGWDNNPEDPQYRTALQLGINGVGPLAATHQELSLANGQNLSQYLVAQLQRRAGTAGGCGRVHGPGGGADGAGRVAG